MARKRFTRRTVLAGLAATTVGSIACSTKPTSTSGDPDTSPDAGNPADAGVDDPVPVTPPTAKYLFQQPLLFQRAHARAVPHTYTNSLGELVTVPGNVGTFDGSDGAGAHSFGSTATFLCTGSRRPWVNQGGDWLDALGVAQGAAAFATSPAIPTGTTAGRVTVDVTAAVQDIFARRHWLALLLKTAGGEMRVVGPLHPTAQPSTLVISFVDGTSETLTLWYAASLRASTAFTNAQDDIITFAANSPLVLEFFRADAPDVRVASETRAVASATLELAHDGTAFGELVAQVFVVNPSVPASLEPLAGFAAEFPLDAGINAHPSVAAALCVTDQHVPADIIDEERSGSASQPWVPTSDPYGRRSEATMDPYLFTPTPGEGDFSGVPAPTEAERNALFPRRVQGARGTKMVGAATRTTANNPIASDSVRLVHSDDALALQRGFTPLAPGLGAVEFLYSGGDVKNGQSTFESVTGAHDTDMEMYFREEHIGRVVDGYMRMYVLLGDGWEPSEQGHAYQFYAPNFDQGVGNYPEEYGLTPADVTWRRLDRTGKFVGGIQQLTSGDTRYTEYVDPTRATGDQTRVATTGGGYSSSSGPFGYQGRWMFRQGYYRPGTPGPCVGGMALGVELFDFNGGGATMIPSQTHVGGWDGSWESFATHTGGLGFLYPRRWYCVEMRWKMNTTRPYELPPVGTHWLEGGHNVDGFIEWWVDGIPAAKTPLFAHRSSAAIIDWALQNASGAPFDTVRGSPDRLRGITNVPPELFMGASSAVFNAYYGGRTYNDSNKFVYLNGIVVSNGEYVGPMAGVSRENGGLGNG